MSSSVSPASATAARQASTVSDSGSTISRRPSAERPTPESTTRCSNRSSLTRRRAASGGRGSATRSTERRSRRSARTAAATRRRAARSGPRTSWPMCTSSGSQPTMFVVRCTVGSSASATIAIAYGGSKPGSHWCWLTVNPTTVPRPDTTDGSTRGCGTPGRSAPAGARASGSRRSRWMRSWPSAPEVQNHSLTGVSWGSGRTRQNLPERNPTAPVAAGNDSVIPEAT